MCPFKVQNTKTEKNYFCRKASAIFAVNDFAIFAVNKGFVVTNGKNGKKLETPILP